MRGTSLAQTQGNRILLATCEEKKTCSYFLPVHHGRPNDGLPPAALYGSGLELDSDRPTSLHLATDLKERHN